MFDRNMPLSFNVRQTSKLFEHYKDSTLKKKIFFWIGSLPLHPSQLIVKGEETVANHPLTSY